MKKFILYIYFVVVAFGASAQTGDNARQDNPKKDEKIRALYVAYISQQLSLTPTEAEKFWPAHAQYEADLRDINKGNLNELDRQQAVLNVKKKYEGNFNKILGSERSNSFYRQDAEFRKKLTDRLKQMRQQRGNSNNANNRMPRGGMQRGGGRLSPQ